MSAISTLNYPTSVSAFSGGNNSGAGRGVEYLIQLGGTHAANDELQLNLVLPAQTYTLAAGNVIGTAPVTCLTLANRVYFTAGSAFYFSALADPTQYETQGVGAGFVDTANQYAEQNDLTGLAPYQGNLAVMSRRNTQIWTIDADPANFTLKQVLPNIGTIAPQSVQAIGDMDVYMLADNGVRSIRVRDASNNAIIADIGTPIDAILQSVLTTLTDAQKAQSCGIVEPTSNRYWLFVPNPADANGVGRIYVFSYFPNSEIAAWSTYEPSYQSPVPAPAANYDGQANIVPAGAAYTNGAGYYTLTGLIPGQTYNYVMGARTNQDYGIGNPPNGLYLTITNTSPDGGATGTFVAVTDTIALVGYSNAPTTIHISLASAPYNIITYTGLTVGARYAWTAGANEVSLTNGAQVLKSGGSFVATAPTAVIVGRGSSAAFTGDLTVTQYFTPSKFVVSNGQVFCRDATVIYQYGGTDGNTYENCGVTAVTPYIDNGSPGSRKSFSAVDAGFEGTWAVQASADYTTQGFKTIYQNSQPSFKYGRLGYGAIGTHYALKMVESGNAYARFSTAIMHMDGQGSEK